MMLRLGLFLFLFHFITYMHPLGYGTQHTQDTRSKTTQAKKQSNKTNKTKLNFNNHTNTAFQHLPFTFLNFLLPI